MEARKLLTEPTLTAPIVTTPDSITETKLNTTPETKTEVKVTVLRTFRDKKLKRMFQKGEIYTVTRERYGEIRAHDEDHPYLEMIKS